jgi:hypothetical protein
MHPDIKLLALRALDQGVPETFQPYDSSKGVEWRDLDKQQFERFLEEFSTLVVQRARGFRAPDHVITDSQFASLFETL